MPEVESRVRAGVVLRLRIGWCCEASQQLTFRDAARAGNSGIPGEGEVADIGMVQLGLAVFVWFDERACVEMVLLELRLDVRVCRWTGQADVLAHHANQINHILGLLRVKKSQRSLVVGFDSICLIAPLIILSYVDG